MRQQFCVIPSCLPADSLTDKLVSSLALPVTVVTVTVVTVTEVRITEVTVTVVTVT